MRKEGAMIPRWERSETAGRERLTPREEEVCRLLALGYTNREIGDELSISERTVETHRANLMKKLRVKTRAELVQFALQHHLLPQS